MPGARGQQGRHAFVSRANQGQARTPTAQRYQADEGGRGRGGEAQRRNQGTLHQDFPGLILTLAVPASPPPPCPPPPPSLPSPARGGGLGGGPGEGRVGGFDVSLPILLGFSAALCLLILLPLSWL